jgi:hypothetical protein
VFPVPARGSGNPGVRQFKRPCQFENGNIGDVSILVVAKGFCQKKNVLEDFPGHGFLAMTTAGHKRSFLKKQRRSIVADERLCSTEASRAYLKRSGKDYASGCPKKRLIYSAQVISIFY